MRPQHDVQASLQNHFEVHVLMCTTQSSFTVGSSCVACEWGGTLLHSVLPFVQKGQRDTFINNTNTPAILLHAEAMFIG